jgi:hypothetical protein
VRRIDGNCEVVLAVVSDLALRSQLRTDLRARVCGGLELAAKMDEPLDAVLVDSQSDEQRVERGDDDERLSDSAALGQPV